MHTVVKEYYADRPPRPAVRTSHSPRRLSLATVVLLAACFGTVPGNPFIKECLDYFGSRHYIRPDGTLDEEVINPGVMALILIKYGFRFFDKTQFLDQNMAVFKSNVFAGDPMTRDADSYSMHFMSEGGITVSGKRIVAEQLSRMASDLNVGNEDHKKKIHEQLVSIFGNVMKAYISDYPASRLCDKQLVSHVVKAIVNAGLGELSEQVMTVYKNDMIDKAICGDRDVNLSFMKDNTPADMNYVETQPYPLMFLPLHYLWPNDDTKDFE